MERGEDSGVHHEQRLNGARLEKDKRVSLRCGDEVVMAGGNDSGDNMGATQGKRRALKARESAS